MSCEEVNDYIIGNNEDGDERNGRQLYVEEDGSLTLLDK